MYSQPALLTMNNYSKLAVQNWNFETIDGLKSKEQKEKKINRKTKEVIIKARHQGGDYIHLYSLTHDIIVCSKLNKLNFNLTWIEA